MVRNHKKKKLAMITNLNDIPRNLKKWPDKLRKSPVDKNHRVYPVRWACPCLLLRDSKERSNTLWNPYSSGHPPEGIIPFAQSWNHGPTGINNTRRFPKLGEAPHQRFKRALCVLTLASPHGVTGADWVSKKKHAVSPMGILGSVLKGLTTCGFPDIS